jgi:hypothetical protein
MSTVIVGGNSRSVGLGLVMADFGGDVGAEISISVRERRVVRATARVAPGGA